MNLKEAYEGWNKTKSELNTITLEIQYLQSFGNYVEKNINTLNVEYDGTDIFGQMCFVVDNTFYIFVTKEEGNSNTFRLRSVTNTNGWWTNSVKIGYNTPEFLLLFDKILSVDTSKMVIEESALPVTIEDKEDAVDRECYVYLQELISPNVKAIKYGIAYNPQKRMKDQESSGMFLHSLILTKKLSTREEARSLEKSIKAAYGGRYVKYEWLNDGYTETLPHTLLEEVKNFIEN